MAQDYVRMMKREIFSKDCESRSANPFISIPADKIGRLRVPDDSDSDSESPKSGDEMDMDVD
jgi:hypothetical protein